MNNKYNHENQSMGAYGNKVNGMGEGTYRRMHELIMEADTLCKAADTMLALFEERPAESHPNCACCNTNHQAHYCCDHCDPNHEQRDISRSFAVC